MVIHPGIHFDRCSIISLFAHRSDMHKKPLFQFWQIVSDWLKLNKVQSQLGNKSPICSINWKLYSRLNIASTDLWGWYTANSSLGS